MVLRFVNVGFDFGHKPLLDGIDFSLSTEEIVAIIGNNGSGKSTLLRMAAGILPPTRGDVYLASRNTKEQRPIERKSLVTWCAGVSPNSAGFSALDFVSLAVQNDLFSRRLLLLRSSHIQICMDALGLFEADTLAYRSIDTLSSGEWQRVQLARAWVNPVGLLLLDEPTTSLDLRHISMLTRRIREFSAKNRASILFSSHDLQFVKSLAHRAVMMREGTLYDLGSPSELNPTQFDFT